MPTIDDPDLERLTRRQRECLGLAAEHWTSKEIGRRLNIAPKTVDRHIEEAARKLGVSDRAAAVRRLLAEGRPLRGIAPDEPERPGGDAHGAPAPMFETVAASQESLRGGEEIHGQTAVDVYLDGRAGRLGDPSRHPAAEESGVLVAGTTEAEFGYFAPGRASGGDHQYGRPSWWDFRGGGWAPEPVRRLTWVGAIAAGVALAAGALIGSYDLILALHRIAHGLAFPTAAGSL